MTKSQNTALSKIQTAVENIQIRYENDATIRMLVQLIPFGLGSAADTVISTRVQRILEERARTFFDELKSGDIELTPDLIESDDFLHCYFATAGAALRAHRAEKTSLFAKLLKSTWRGVPPRDVDEYDELLGIIDDLSFTEWRALEILDRYSDRPRERTDNGLQWTRKFWEDFLHVIETELQIPSDEIVPFLNRIERTGLYAQFVGGFMSYSGGVGKLTARYHRLKAILAEPKPT